MTKKIQMRAVDAREVPGALSKAKFEQIIKEHGLKKGRAYPVTVEVEVP